MSTAYHPQTDGQSERTNQTVEIALRFLTTEYTTSWVKVLPSLSATLNNSVSSTTGMSPNEYITGAKAREIPDMVNPTKADKSHEQMVLDREVFRQEVRDSLTWANAKAKLWYDHKHKPLIMKPGDKAWLRLHRGYCLPGKPNRKLSQQRMGPFKILERIGQLAYRLELPERYKIHPVISVA